MALAESIENVLKTHTPAQMQDICNNERCPIGVSNCLFSKTLECVNVKREHWVRVYTKYNIPQDPMKNDAPTVGISSDPVSPQHYSRWKIEPLHFIKVNNIDYLRGNIIKYILRYDAKNGMEDLKKAERYLQELVEYARENGYD